MRGETAPSAKGTARVSHLADERRDHSKSHNSPQLLTLCSGGLIDAATAEQAQAWGRALECDAAYFIRRRRNAH